MLVDDLDSCFRRNDNSAKHVLQTTKGPTQPEDKRLKSVQMILEFADNSLIILCGPAGSGKSYFAERFFKPNQVVSSDHCRDVICDDHANQVVSADAFELFYAIVGYRLKYSRLTVADATNLSAPYRNRLRRIAAGYNREVYLVAFVTDLDQCVANNASRDRRVERQVIETQIAKLQTALQNIPSEPYRQVYRLVSTQIDDLQVRIIPPTAGQIPEDIANENRRPSD